MRKTGAMTRMTTGLAALLASLVLVTLVPAAAATGVGSAPAGASAARAGAAQAAPAQNWRARMLERVNATRAQAGVPPVAACGRLGRSAQRYAATMARSGAFGHIAPDGTGPGERISAVGYRWRMLGENIAAGQVSVYQVMQGWRGSSSHLATMTDPAFTHVGFGLARSADARTYWVQDFGSGRC
jgi:uncharacterized protein YkwD